MAKPDDLAALIARIAQRHSVPPPILLAMVAPLVKAAGATDIVALDRLLTRRAADAATLRRRLAVPVEDATLAGWRSRAAAALESGNFAEVDKALAQAELQILGELTNLSDLPPARRIATGDTRADRGAVSQLDLAPQSCRETAKRYAEASAIVGLADPARSLELALLQGDALTRLGEEFGDRTGFDAAIAHYRVLLAGLDNFEETVGWASVQERLGVALAGLAGLVGDAALLDQAASCYLTALEDLRRDQAPALWRALKVRFGRIAVTLGEAREDEALLEEAVTALATALAAWDRKGDEARWLEAEHLISRARAALGRRQSDLALLERSFNGFNRVAQAVDRTQEPLRWAELQDQMGGVLAAMGERYSEPVVLEEAIAAFGFALEERRPETTPQLWAKSSASQGLASIKLAARLQDRDLAQRALMQIATAVEAMRAAGHSADAAALQKKLVIAGGVAEGMGKARTAGKS